MAFSEHKITNFTHRLSDLPDQPNLSAVELKAYFDSSPEELRQAHNALCADADRLDDRVSGIVAGTFGDAIPKAMLSTELQAELDAKAEEAAVAERLAAADTRIGAVEAALPQKCEVFFGVYEGDGASTPRLIALGFTPKAVLVLRSGASWNYSGSIYGGIALPGYPSGSGYISVVENGFQVTQNTNKDIFINSDSYTYYFIAFK